MTFWQGTVVALLWISMGVLYIQSNRGLLITLATSMNSLPLVTIFFFIAIVLLWPVVVNAVAVKSFWGWFQQYRRNRK